MTTAGVFHSVKFKSMKAFSAMRRFSHSQSFIILGQALLIFVQFILLAVLLDWLVSALLHLPMMVTLIATTIFMAPAFFVCWWIMRAIWRQSKHQIM